MPPETDDLTLSNLQPAQKRTPRKRVGRGLGSGKGRYAGRGIKGQKARSGSHNLRPGFEGGQMPVYMRLGKQRGPYSKDAMPIGPHRTRTLAVNVADLERVFEDGADVTLEALVEKRLVKNARDDVKILGNGDLRKKLRVTAHAFSARAREKIEAAGGSATSLREPSDTTESEQPSTAKETDAEAAGETTRGAKGEKPAPDPALGETGAEQAPGGEG